MKKHRILAAAALLVLPSVLFSGSGYSNSQLPQIDADASRFGQQSCPVDNGGCGGLNGIFGANPMIGSIIGNAERLRLEHFKTCMQFIKKIFPPARQG